MSLKTYIQDPLVLSRLEQLLGSTNPSLEEL